MSATSALLPQEDDLAKLLAIASLTKEDIIAKGEETRKQITLTQEQEGKVAEAKAYIAQHGALAADIQRREDELKANKAALESAVSTHAAHVASENTRLETFAADLTARESALATAQKIHDANVAQLAADKDGHQNQNKEAAQKNTDIANTHIAIGKELERERLRLKDWEDTLKRKAEMARKTMADF